MKKNKKQHIVNMGDVIYFAKNYIVLERKNGKLKCLPLNISLKNDKFNQTFLEHIDYTNEVILDLNQMDIHYLITLNNEFVNLVIENYELYKQRKQTVERGALVLARGQLHYIYSEEGQEFIAFKLQKKYSEKLEPIVINEKTYYIDFSKTVNINKKEDFDIKNLASNEEMINIRNLKRNYFGSNDVEESTRISNLKVCKENLKTGSVFKLKDNNDMLVVIRVDGRLVTYINQIYLDAVLDFQNNTDLKCIDVILDTSEYTREINKEKIKTLIDAYK